MDDWRFAIGDLVRIKSLEEIKATLDEDGKCDEVYFNEDEMARYCGETHYLDDQDIIDYDFDDCICCLGWQWSWNWVEVIEPNERIRQLKPGDIVTTLDSDHIRQTLDSFGQYDGYEFNDSMDKFCEKSCYIMGVCHDGGVNLDFGNDQEGTWHYEWIVPSNTMAYIQILF